MRVRGLQSVRITSGRLLICDPGYLFELTETPPFVRLPPGAAFFDDFGGDGDFRVFTNGRTIVVDTAPRQFRSKSQVGFRPLEGSVPVDSGVIAFLDACHFARQGDEHIAKLVFQTEVPNAEYRVWEEERESSSAFRRRILCFGPSVELLMHGPAANQLLEIEHEVALALQFKGAERGLRLHSLRERLLELHVAGIKDPRLRALAAAAKLELPRIRKA